MSKSAYLRVFSAICVVAVLCLALGGCHATNDFNWTMYGAVIDVNGQITEYLQFTAEGTLHDYTNKPDQLNIQVQTPQNFRYFLPNSDNVHIDESGKHVSLPYFACHTYAYDKVAESAIFSAFALDIDGECAIFRWNNADGSYLVGCTDPDADLAAVFDHFAEFVKNFSNSKT